MDAHCWLLPHSTCFQAFISHDNLSLKCSFVYLLRFGNTTEETMNKRTNKSRNKNAKKLYSTQIFVRNDVDWLNNRFCSAVAWKSADIWSISASTWSINRSIDRNSNRNIDKCYSRFRSIENGREIAAFVFEKIFIRSMVGTFSTLIVE